ncbi:SprT family protein [Staphylococcus cohnii]|uniref:SprT family protein n=1 Tax=Staphylococcus TaxID=1279 RepID=UPI000D1CA051|nr:MULTISPECIES: SprT family protein [Staphylococcus]MBB2508877.1 Protein SprT-like protein [Staphylococcus cohnii subsp. barensis]PTE75901.1 SprT family protein [Staphylococcus cohnii]PTF34876.1 SprT family protein [Staphylococcus cohnii]RIL75537.1 SprT family protein [Staphylococcus cohnii]RIL89250.1 SprT family protein [Staphylococcus cohnii]
MDNEKLQKLTEYISITVFERPFKHSAYFNKRLRTTGGRYILNTHNIEINKKQYDAFGENAVIDIIKHELCHYHLHIQGKGYKHRDKDFKVLSAQTGSPRFCSAIESYEDRVRYIYKCSNCGAKYTRIRKVNINKMFCGRCKGKLIEKKRV